MLKSLLPLLATLVALLTIWIHPVSSQTSDNDVINSLRSCLPQDENIEFQVITHLDVKSPDVWRYYLIMASHEDSPILWPTIPELKKNGTCVNRYPEQHIDAQLSLIPKAIAERFLPLAQAEQDKAWAPFENDLQRVADERGVPITRVGWD